MYVMGLMLPLVWSWTCDHDKLQRSLSARQKPEPLDEFSAQLQVIDRQPIRIKIDATYVDTANPDGLPTCQEVGQNITWAGETYACLEGDLWTKEKSEIVKETFENVRQFLVSTLKVYQIRPWAPVRDRRDYPVPMKEGENVFDADLYVVLYPRPFGEGSRTLASAVYVQQDDLGRPMQGAVNVNLAVIPEKAQNVSTVGDRGFFETALHEICHVLGISGHAIENEWRNMTWVDDNTLNMTIYGRKYIYERKVDGKVMKILHTPKLHELMRERLGIEYFDDNENYPVGVEIEDGGGSGTVGSHWEERVFFTELMVGTTHGYARISDVTLSALEDSGWYDVDHSVAEPLEWGDYRSIRGAKQDEFKDFASGRPVEVWPDHYVAKRIPQHLELGCSFDHRAVGRIQVFANRDCSKKPLGECQYPGFYDPNNTGYYGSETMDYVFVTQPFVNAICAFEAEGTYKHPGYYFGRNSMCARTTLGLKSPGYTCFRMGCDEDGTLSIGVGKEAKQCKGKGDQLQFPNTGYDGYVECPDPDIVCGILGYNGTSSPIPEYTGEDVKNPNKGGGNKGLSLDAWIGIGVGCVGLVAIVVLIIIVIRRHKNMHREQVSA